MSVDIENNLSEAGWCAQAPCVRSPLDYSPSVLEIPSEAGGYSDETWVCSGMYTASIEWLRIPFRVLPVCSPDDTSCSRYGQGPGDSLIATKTYRFLVLFFRVYSALNERPDL